jgi:hypothetical protein
MSYIQAGQVMDNGVSAYISDDTISSYDDDMSSSYDNMSAYVS